MLGQFQEIVAPLKRKKKGKKDKDKDKDEDKDEDKDKDQDDDVQWVCDGFVDDWTDDWYNDCREVYTTDIPLIASSEPPTEISLRGSTEPPTELPTSAPTSPPIELPKIFTTDYNTGKPTFPPTTHPNVDPSTTVRAAFEISSGSEEELFTNNRTSAIPTIVRLSPFTMKLQMKLPDTFMRQYHDLSKEEEDSLRVYTETYLSRWYRLQLEPGNVEIEVDLVMRRGENRFLQEETLDSSSISFRGAEPVVDTTTAKRIVQCDVKFQHIPNEWLAPSTSRLDYLTAWGFEDPHKRKFLADLITIGNVLEEHGGEVTALSFVTDVTLGNSGGSTDGVSSAAQQVDGGPTKGSDTRPFLLGAVLGISLLAIALAIYIIFTTWSRKRRRELDAIAKHQETALSEHKKEQSNADNTTKSVGRYRDDVEGGRHIGEKPVDSGLSGLKDGISTACSSDDDKNNSPMMGYSPMGYSSMGYSPMGESTTVGLEEGYNMTPTSSMIRRQNTFTVEESSLSYTFEGSFSSLDLPSIISGADGLTIHAPSYLVEDEQSYLDEEGESYVVGGGESYLSGEENSSLNIDKFGIKGIEPSLDSKDPVEEILANTEDDDSEMIREKPRRSSGVEEISNEKAHVPRSVEVVREIREEVPKENKK